VSKYPIGGSILESISSIIESKRVILKAPSLEYALDLHQAIQESIEDLRIWLKWAQHVPNLGECRENISRAIEAIKDKRELQFYIFTKENDTLIGCCGLHRIDWTVPKFEIGYWLRTSYRRQGYASEVAKALTQFAFNNLGANRVEIRCDEKNVRSKLVAENLGFVLEGILRNESLTPDGHLRSTMVFSRVKSDC
jgi:ribosomal-protein-serine acetyltransferase